MHTIEILKKCILRNVKELIKTINKKTLSIHYNAI